jgi:hypothetical protein
LLQPLLDELLFVGSDYERAFDKFEMLYAIEYAHQADRDWAPVGRFGWKAASRDSSPMLLMTKEAGATRNAWPPLAAGLCGVSIERFSAVTQRLAENVMRTAR